MLGTLVSAFQAFPEEGLIVGRLLTGYTTIEYQLCMCAGMGGAGVAKAITEIFSKRGETRRVKTIAPLWVVLDMRPPVSAQSSTRRSRICCCA